MSENEIILTHILQCRPIDLVINKPVLNTDQQIKYEEYKNRREAGEPLQYILGTCNFMGLELAVNPSVLIPRPETEQLVDAALKFFKGGDVLDLGTGSGNIAIALAKFVPLSKIVSVDISAQALEVAKTNARNHGVENKIKFIQADISLTSLFLEAGECFYNNAFDLIISNPPYIPTFQISNLPRDVQKEPVLALDGGVDGLSLYRNIIKNTPSLLRVGGCLMMEFGDGQAFAIKDLMQIQGSFSSIQIFRDLAGRERVIKSMRIKEKG